MILITGGTGFVGSALIRQLVAQGRPVRTLIRPAKKTPNLPKSTPVDVVVCSIFDQRGLQSAMKGVQYVFHLAGSEREGSRANLEDVDIQGTRMIVNAAHQAGVERLFFLSHLGAERASAYAVFKAKGIAEGLIQQGDVPYTILRSSVIFGPQDQFTTSLTRMLQISPGIFFMPGDGENQMQPIWIEDVVTCLMLCLEDTETSNKVFSIGGPEYFTFRQVLNILAERIGVKRNYVSINPSYLRSLSLLLEQGNPRFPISVHWLDYLASDRTCPVDVLPRQFGLLPSRFTQNLDYIHNNQKKRNIRK